MQIHVLNSSFSSTYRSVHKDIPIYESICYLHHYGAMLLLAKITVFERILGYIWDQEHSLN